MSDLSKMLDMPQGVLGEPGLNLAGMVEREADAFRTFTRAMAETAKTLTPLFKSLTQFCAEAEEQQRRIRAAHTLSWAKLWASIDPTWHYEVVTTPHDGCRVIVKRLGGWA